MARIEVNVCASLKDSITEDIIDSFRDRGCELDITEISALDKDSVVVNIQVWSKDDEKSIQKPKRVLS